jgi:C_GCAxxG_C_C family probable redox protein
MLVEKCRKYYNMEYNLNCAECMLYAANDEYNLGIDKTGLKLAAGFGGGMAVEDVCGAVTGSIMVLGAMFVDKKAHESDRIKTLTREFIERFNKKLGTVNCKELKALYRDDEKRCMDIILAAGEILEDIIKRERSF